MANLFESYGLDFVTESEDTFANVAGYTLQNGKVIKGYYGAPYVFQIVGAPEFWASTVKDEEGKFCFDQLHVHCGGRNIWDMVCTDIDLSPKDMSKTERILMLSRGEVNPGMLPIDIFDADVLPSFLKGDRISLQVVAPCLDVNYYATQEDYDKAMPRDKHGKQWGMANGSLAPLCMLVNHNPDTYDKEKDYESDYYIHFCATVKSLHLGLFELEEVKEPTFIMCKADTLYGELDFMHSIDQVPEEMRENIKVGSIISGVCIITGDAVIQEYENGIVKDFDHDLRLLRYTFQKGEAERLRSVLTENSVYETETYNTSYTGPDAIIDRFNYVEENHEGKYFAHLAEITETEEEGMEFPVGTKCIVLAADEEDHYESIVFMTTDDEGNISRILICRDSRYRFRIEWPPRIKTPLDDIKIPESVAEPIMARAKFHRLLDEETEYEQIAEDPDYYDHEVNAKRMLEAWETDHQPDAVKTVGFLLGYLFAKAVEMTVNDKKLLPTDPDAGFSPSDGCWGRLRASYSPHDALRGELQTTLDPDKHAALLDVMELAQQFGKDVFVFMEMTGKTDDDFTDIFTQAAVIVQRIGEIFAMTRFEKKEEQ